MQTRQGSMLQSLRNADAFLELHSDALPAVARSGVRLKLAEVVATLSMHVTDQAASTLAARGATKKHYALRRSLLREHMLAVARIAAAELPLAPEILPLRMPAPAIGAEKLAASAYGMAQAAAPHARVFISAGLPVDFITQLTATADAMLQSLDDRARSRGSRRSATKGLQERLSAGRKIVRVLDAFVSTALRDDPALLAGWKTAKRVRIIAGGRPSDASSPPERSTSHSVARWN